MAAEALPKVKQVLRLMMKRLHVHVSVNDLNESVRFYRELFAADPAVLKSDYAKWMLEDPRVNFSPGERRRIRVSAQ